MWVAASPPRRRGPHCQGDDATVYTDRWKWPLRAVLGHLCTLLRLARIVRATVGTRRSVHRSAKMAPRSRFGAFVYTVATRVAIQIATRAAQGGTSASTTTACRRRPLADPSRLVGKTGSERVAPLPGRHLRRGVNPHEPPKSLLLSTVPKTSGAESFGVGGTWETWPTITLVAEAGSAVSVGDGSSSVAAEGTFAAGRCGGHRHGATSSDRERGRRHGAGLARI